MKFKFIIALIFILCTSRIFSANFKNESDSLIINLQGIIDTDSLLENAQSSSDKDFKKIKFDSKKNLSPNKKESIIKGYNAMKIDINAFDSLVNEKKAIIVDTLYVFRLPEYAKPIIIDSLLLQANPFFIDLVYQKKQLDFGWNLSCDFRKMLYKQKATNLTTNTFTPIIETSAEAFIHDLRFRAKNEITLRAPELYKYRYDELPDPNQNKNSFIESKKIARVQFVPENETNYSESKQIKIQKALMSPWLHESSALMQFSENFVSENWYQGGNSNLAVLGILMGKLNYDNKKNIQWDNNAEWRMGFNSVSGDTIRLLNTNNDLFRINSKLGIKAGGNWFYSGSVEFSAQFFDSYNGINSMVMKTTFLTPIRVNIGVGFDYKYKKIFSIMFSPVSYKYIYLNEKDPAKINPNIFGIKKDEHILSEMGSSFRAVYSYSPSREIQLDSKLMFYTNYEKVEIDWEFICNFTINRFMSTRISFNPRYDNTVIEKNGDKAKIQLKQLLSIGFSHKFK